MYVECVQIMCLFLFFYLRFWIMAWNFYNERKIMEYHRFASCCCHCFWFCFLFFYFFLVFLHIFAVVYFFACAKWKCVAFFVFVCVVASSPLFFALCFTLSYFSCRCFFLSDISFMAFWMVKNSYTRKKSRMHKKIEWKTMRRNKENDRIHYLCFATPIFYAS